MAESSLHDAWQAGDSYDSYMGRWSRQIAPLFLDWIDVPRRFVPADKKLFSWWSYRNRDWRLSNRGRRLDHILASPALAGATRSHRIDTDLRDWEKASDHVPVLASFDV